jgi:hypothetical protein
MNTMLGFGVPQHNSSFLGGASNQSFTHMKKKSATNSSNKALL